MADVAPVASAAGRRHTLVFRAQRDGRKRILVGWQDKAENLAAWYFSVRDTRWFRWAELALVILSAGTFFYFYQFASDHLCGTDPYYHIKFAYVTRHQGIIHNFHWARFSWWHEHFFDKEFIYHLYLSMFTFGDLIQGAKWATVVMGTAIFTAYFLVLRENGVRYRWLWWLLLGSSGGYLLFRVNVTRPQTLSIFLLIVGLHFLINERHWIVGLLSLVYSLSYTGHYQYVGLAFIFLVVVRLKDHRWSWKPAVWALVGMLLGWLIHPNFPNNIQGFFVQNVLVIFHQLHKTVDLHMGGELNSMTARSLINVNPATLIPLWLGILVAIVRPFATNTRTLFLFVASTIYLVLTLNTKRFAEYWIPVTGLFNAFYYSSMPESLTLGSWWKNRRWAFYAMSAVLILGIPFLAYQSHKDTYRQLDRCGESTYMPSARWLAKHVPSGAGVLTCDWDDAPYLFFESTEHDYTVFLDPTFMYFWNPDMWHRWDRLTHGKDAHPIDTIVHRFKSRFVYCTSDFGDFKKQLSRYTQARLIYPVPNRSLLPHVCAVNLDCPDATICNNPKCRPGKPCHKRTGQCVPDPHVFMYEIYDQPVPTPSSLKGNGVIPTEHTPRGHATIQPQHLGKISRPTP